MSVGGRGANRAIGANSQQRCAPQAPHQLTAEQLDLEFQGRIARNHRRIPARAVPIEAGIVSWRTPPTFMPFTPSSQPAITLRVPA